MGLFQPFFLELCVPHGGAAVGQSSFWGVASQERKEINSSRLEIRGSQPQPQQPSRLLSLTCVVPARITGIIGRKVRFFNTLAARGWGNPACSSPEIWDQFVQMISSPDWLAQNIWNIPKTLGPVGFNTAKLLGGVNGAQSFGSGSEVGELLGKLKVDLKSKLKLNLKPT